MSETRKEIEDGGAVWLIWSNQHEAWWRPEGKGYTSDWQSAGRYSLDEAVGICQCGAKYGLYSEHRRTTTPEEVMVPAPEYLNVLQAQDQLVAARQSSTPENSHE